MRNMLTDAHMRLLRAIRGAIAADHWFEPWLEDNANQQFSLVIEDFASEPWASLTFTGMRHSIDIRLCGPQMDVEAAYDRLEVLMREPDLNMPGHFLADIERVHSNGEIGRYGQMTLRLRYEALTIAE